MKRTLCVWSAWVGIGCVVLAGCATPMRKLPVYPKGPLQVQLPAKQKGSPCGQAAMLGAKKTQPLVMAGAEGHWVDTRRLRCLLARSEVARNARPAMQRLLAKVNRSHKHVLATFGTIARNREMAIVAHYKAEITKRNVVIILGGVALALGATVIGIFVGKAIFSPQSF